MTLVRSQKGQDATMTLEIDHAASDKVIEELRAIDGVNRVIVINSLG